MFYFFLAGCTSKTFYEGDIRGSYNPVPINEAQEKNSALIKTANGISIWKVDDKREVNGFKVMVSGGLDSILVDEGFHTISCTRGGDIHIGRTYYKKGNEYLIDYLEEKDGNRRRVHYWVKDLTEDRIVYGEEKKIEDLIEE